MRILKQCVSIVHLMRVTSLSLLPIKLGLSIIIILTLSELMLISVHWINSSHQDFIIKKLTLYRLLLPNNCWCHHPKIMLLKFGTSLMLRVTIRKDSFHTLLQNSLSVCPYIHADSLQLSVSPQGLKFLLSSMIGLRYLKTSRSPIAN